MRRITRRQFLARSAAAAAIVGAAPLIASCSAGSRSAVPRGEPLAPGFEPEAGPLKLLNWEQHMSRSVLDTFATARSTDWEYHPFFETNEELTKLAQESFDVAVVPLETLPAAIVQGLVQPLSAGYLENATNVWPQALDALRIDPAFAMPYTVGKAGIGWWPDRVSPGIDLPHGDPYEAFWMQDLRDLVALPSGYREGIALGLRRAGIDDLSTGDPALIERAEREWLRSAARADLPDPGLWLAWSGDVVTRPPEPDGPRYSFGLSPLLVADALVIPSRAPHPVLAHAFIDHLLQPEVASENSLWLGYRQPVDFSVTPGPEYVTPADLEQGSLYGPLDDEADALWRRAWDNVTQALALD